MTVLKMPYVLTARAKDGSCEGRVAALLLHTNTQWCHQMETGIRSPEG